MRSRIFIGKWIYIIGFCFFVSCTSTSETPVTTGPDPLDAAIREISDYLNERLEPDIKLVFLNFQSDSPTLSEYIIEGLIENTVNDNLFTVVDRQNLALIQQEMHFQLSGEVSDESAQAIGKLLGAQTIVSGAVSQMGNSYRMRVRAINVETAEIQGQLSRDIIDSQRITFLFENYRTSLSESAYPSGSVTNSGIVNSEQAPSTGNKKQSNQTEESVSLPSDTASSPVSLPVINDSALPYEQFTVLRQLDTRNTSKFGISPDGKYIIVDTNSGRKLCDTETGKTIRNIDIPRFSVIAFSPDSKRVITNNNHNIRITDIESGAFRDCTGHTQAIRSLAYSPDGKYFVSCASTSAVRDSDNTIRIWNAETGQEVIKITGHTNSVLSAIYSPDGRTIASCGSDNTVKFWNAETGTEVRSITVTTRDTPSRLAYSPDGSKIAVAISSRIIVYDTSNGRELFNFTGHTGAITGIRFNPEGNRLLSVSQGDTKKCYVWNMSSGWGTENRNVRGMINGLDLSRDGAILVIQTGSVVNILGIE